MGRTKVVELPHMRARIYLVRHGETEWSLSVRHRADTDISLTGSGHCRRVLAARWISLPVRQTQRFLLATVSLSNLDCEHDQAESPAIVLWNADSRDVLEREHVRD
ncbi:MAG: histidine phosphatase family protein [Candidatus Binatia bacterium]